MKTVVKNSLIIIEDLVVCYTSQVNLNLQGKQKKVQVIGSSSYRG